MSELCSDSSISSPAILVIVIMIIFLVLIMYTVCIIVWALRDSLPQELDEGIPLSPLRFTYSEISEQSEEELREISPESHSSNT
jgi:uncharacterized membrane protein